MKKIYEWNNFGYYIEIDGNIIDEDMAKYLGIDYEEYINILIKYKACKNFQNGEYYFKELRDLKKCLKILNPYIIMATLTK